MKTKNRDHIKTELNKIGKGFCLAKWYELDLDLSLGQNRSCDLVNFHSIPLSELQVDIDLFNNSNYKKVQRKFMLDEIQPKECNLCWEIEKTTKKSSPRIEKSANFFTEPNIKKVQEVSYIKNIDPEHLKILFSRNDNILSIYESPYFSQTWQRHIEKFGSYIINSTQHNDINFTQFNTLHHSQYKNIYIELFWSWFSKIYFKLTKLTIYGGDALMDKNIFRILQFFKYHRNENLVLEIKSKCDPSGERWSGFLEQLKVASKNVRHVNLYCNISSWGPCAEYIHYGLSIKRLEKNLRAFLKICKNRTLIFEIDFHVLSYQSIIYLLRKVHELRIKFFNKGVSVQFEIKVLNSPKFFHPGLFREFSSNLDVCLKFMKENLETRGNRYLGFTNDEVNQIENLKDTIEFYKFDTADIDNFFEFIEQYDQRNNLCFDEVFFKYRG